jgi:hypothetical protein
MEGSYGYGTSPIERSFLAGETEAEFSFRTTNWNTRSVSHHGFEEAAVMAGLERE